MPRSTIYAKKVRINRQGYDSSGKYWGAGGQPLYLVTNDDGDFAYVRASTATVAKAAAKAEWGARVRRRSITERLGEIEFASRFGYR